MATKSDLPPIPQALADVAFIDGPSVAAAACISLSALHELVRLKDAPAPAIRRPRCTRWKLAEVRTWLIERASRPTGSASAELIANATKASAAARTPAALAKAQATRAAKKTAALASVGE